jgi:hypothetical protein
MKEQQKRFMVGLVSALIIMSSLFGVISAATYAANEPNTAVTVSNLGKVYYPAEWGGHYFSSYFTVNNGSNTRIGYCLEPKRTTPGGSFTANPNNELNLMKVLYYGYGGNGDISESLLPGMTNITRYIYTHVAAAYAYGSPDWAYGINETGKASVMAYYNAIMSQADIVRAKSDASVTYDVNNAKVIVDVENKVQTSPLFSGNGHFTVPDGLTCYVGNENYPNGEAAVYDAGSKVTVSNQYFYFKKSFTDVAGGNNTASSTTLRLDGVNGIDYSAMVIYTGTTSQTIGYPGDMSVVWANPAGIQWSWREVITNTPSPESTEYQLKLTKYSERQVKANTGTSVYALPNDTSTVVGSLAENETLISVGAYDDEWVSVIASNHDFGYVKKSDVTIYNTGCAGAVYGVFSDAACTDKLGEFPLTDNYGKANFPEAIQTTQNTLYIKELVPPKGYVKSNRIYYMFPAIINEETLFVNAHDDLQKIRVNLNKYARVNAGGTTYDNLPITGSAVYGVYSDAGATQLVKQVTTNDTGYAEFELPLIVESTANPGTYLNGIGDYYVKEITAPMGYKLNETVYKLSDINPNIVNGDTSGNEYIDVMLDVWDEAFGIDITVTKKENVSGNLNTVSGATYGLFTKGDVRLSDGTLIYGPDTKIAEKVTDSNGQIIFDNVLMNASYYVKELSAPTGYIVDETEYDVDYSSATFNANKYSVDVTVYEEVPTGSITVYKKGEILTGAISNEDGYEFTYDETYLPGAVFELYAKEAITGNVYHSYNAGELVDTKTTDENGSVTFTGLDLGVYEVREKEAPEGFKLSTETKTVAISFKDQNTSVVVGDTQTFINERERVKVRAIKNDTNGNKLAGAIIGLYASSDIKVSDGSVVVAKDALISKVISDSESPVIFNVDLPYNTEYYVKEIVPPAGYTTNDRLYSFMPKTATSEYYFSVTVTDTASVVRIKKVNEGNEYVSGASLQILDKNGSIIDEWISSDGPKDFTGRLKVNEEYTLRELSAPSGYSKAADVTFVVPDSSDVFEVTMVDKAIAANRTSAKTPKIEISKVDKDTKKNIEGAVLKLYDKDEKNVIASWTSGKEGYQMNLAAGEYVLVEEKAPEGYLVADKLMLTVKGVDEIQKFVMEDEPKKETPNNKKEEPKEEPPSETQKEEPQKTSTDSSVMEKTSGYKTPKTDDNGEMGSVIRLNSGHKIFARVMICLCCAAALFAGGLFGYKLIRKKNHKDKQ